MKRFVLLIVIITPFVFAKAAYPAGDTGVIGGRVINGTIQKPMANIKVELTLFTFTQDRGISMVRKVDTLTDSDGAYRFEGLEKGFVYRVNVNYKFISYDTDFLTFGKDKEIIKADVNVYEPSEEGEDAIEIADKSIIVESADRGLLQITEVIRVINRKNTAFIGKIKNDAHGRMTLILPLPDGYRGLSIYGGGDFMDSPGELMVRSRILPGENILSYGYTLLYSGGSRRLYLPLTGSGGKAPQILNLVVPSNIGIDGEGFEKKGVRVLNGRSYDYYTVINPFRGDNKELKVTLTGLPHESKFFGVLIFISSFAFLFVFTYVLVKKRGSHNGKEDEDLRISLMRSIALMDEAFDDGEIEEEEYRFERERLMQELIRLETERKVS